jgi:hypothetical protein
MGLDDTCCDFVSLYASKRMTDLVPRQMVEFGHVLPEAGDEARWAAALPEADRAYMESFALKH